jgi:membrane protease YdiL (CAAX protease family)
VSGVTAEAPPERPPLSPWTWTDVVLAVPLSVGLAFLVAFGLLATIVPLLPPHDHELRNAVTNLLVQASLYAGGVGAVVGLVKRRQAPLRTLGWAPVPARWVAGAVPLALLAYVLVIIAGILGGALFPHAHNNQPTAVRGAFGHYLPLAVIAVSLIAPFAEETLFRGFLFGWLRGRVPLWLAVAISSLVFALAHGELALLLPTFTLGCLLALIYHRSGSLWPGMIVHGVFNLVGVTLILSNH